MRISYLPLKHLLVAKKMSMNQLGKATGLSSATIAKINKGGNINTEVLVRICKALDCDLTDIMKLENEEQQIL